MSLNTLSSEPQLDSNSSPRRRLFEVLGVSALLLSVGCQNPGTEEADSKDSTDKKSPIRVGITRKGRPTLRVRVPRESKATTAPTATAHAPEPARQEECVVKGNISGEGKKLYHIADVCPDYESVKINKQGEKCFDTEAEARTAGWKKANNCK